MQRISVLWLSLSLGVWTGAAPAADWRLVKDEAGIKVYLSSVEGSEYKAFRGVVIINADIARVRAFQDDVAASCAWIHPCRRQELLERKGEQSWVHTYFHTPWPVTPRDSIILSTTERLADGGLVRYLRADSTYLPEEIGYVRITKVDGLWRLESKGRGRVEVTYQLHVEPGGGVPAWMANRFVVETPFRTLRDLRDLAESR